MRGNRVSAQCRMSRRLPADSGRWAFSVQRYGMLQWGDLFTARQKVALVELGRFTTGFEGLDGELQTLPGHCPLSQIGRWELCSLATLGLGARK